MTTAHCSRCPYTIRLRKDGRVGKHWLYGTQKKLCEGSGQIPREKADAVLAPGEAP